MRTPVVKRQTLPQSGFSNFFPPCWAWRRHPLATCADLMSLGRPSHMVSAPHTYGGSVTIVMARAERRGGVLCGLATSPCPRPVLGQGVAACQACASEAQVRRRGSPRQPHVPRAASRGAGAEVQSQATGAGPKGLGAPPRSLTQWMMRARHARLRPGSSREAVGAAAPSPGEARRHGEDRVAFEHGGDRPRSLMREDGERFALPRLVLQAGQRLRPSGVGPERCPADSLAHVTRRHDEPPAWPRGQRAISCIS